MTEFSSFFHYLFLLVIFNPSLRNYQIIFTSSGSGLSGTGLFWGLDGFGRLFVLLLADGDDVDVDLPLALLLLVSLAGGGGQRERQRQGRGTHDLGLCLSQQTLLRGVGVLVGEERGQKGERAVAGGAAELGACLR